MKNKLVSKKDLLLLTALILVALLVFIVSWKGKAKGNILIITVNGKETVREQLNGEKEIRIETEDGGFNVINVVRTEEGGFAIKCSESNCPEKVCINKGLVTLCDDPIVCLPHRMTAKLVSR